MKGVTALGDNKSYKITLTVYATAKDRMDLSNFIREEVVKPMAIKPDETKITEIREY